HHDQRDRPPDRSRGGRGPGGGRHRMSWLIPAGYVLVLVLLVVGYSRRRPQLRDYPPQASGPLVSAIIPARNEAANIDTCVRSVLGTAYDPVEIVVVDDGSTDGTGEIVERLVQAPETRGRVRLVRGAALPAAWFGKQWALIQGYRVARGELLLFIDADTRSEEHTSELQSRGHLVCRLLLEKKKIRE